MKYFKTKKYSNIINVILILLITAIVYTPLKNAFFQQDRWLVMGKILTLGKGYVFVDFPGTFRALLGEGRFLARVVTYLLMSNPFNFLPSSIYSISIHSINSLLVYVLLNRLTDNRKISLFSALFFALSGVAFSAVIWLAASVVTLTSTMFILFSLIFYFEYIKIGKNKNLLISFVLLFLSLQFKEIGIFLFLLYPIGLIIFGKLRIKGLLKKYWLLVISLSLVVVSRLWNFAKHTGPVALYLTGSNENYLSTLFVRLLYYPFVSLSQTLVPAQYLIPLSRRLTDIFFPSYEGVNYLVMAETTVLDMVSTLLSFFVLIIIFLVYRKVKTNTKKELLFFLTFTFLSFIPYIIVKKSFSYLDSRFYYLGVLGMSSILSTVLKFFKLHKNMIIYSLAFFLIVPHALIVRGELNKIVQVSKERKNIIVSFENIIKNQKNKNKVVFYLDGDTDYYLPGHKVPFQGGIGYIFMVLSSNYLEIQENLFVDEYLFEIGSQGYKNEYGYFSDIGMLNEHIRKGNFKTSDIVFLKYFGGEQKLLDETTK